MIYISKIIETYDLIETSTELNFSKLWWWFALSTLFQGEIFLNFDENRSKCLIWTCWTYKPAWITGSSLPYMQWTCRTRLWTLSRKNLMTTRENLLARPVRKNTCPNQLLKLTHVLWPMMNPSMVERTMKVTNDFKICILLSGKVRWEFELSWVIVLNQK